MTMERRMERNKRWYWQRQLFLLAIVSVVSSFFSSSLLDLGFPVTSVEALAGAKSKRQGKKQSSGRGKGGGFGGFGTPPPTLDDFLAGVKTTRFPKNGDSLPCPCGKIVETTDTKEEETVFLSYAQCCGPLLDQKALPCGGCKTPLQVLQSRYTAFCYRNIGHVIRTTHEECRDYRDDKVTWAKDLDKEGMFDSFEFTGLEVVDDNDKNNDNDNEAFLEFKVRLRGRSLDETPSRSRSISSIAGEETIVSERSRFLRNPDSGTWKYAGGDVRSTVEGLEDTTLNA